MFQTLLVPTDGSAGAERAVATALALADTFDAALHTLSVVDLGHMVVDEDSDAWLIERALEADAERTTGAVLDRAETAGVERAERAVRYGRPATEILDYAEEHGVDCIVMGTHGRRGLDHFLLGSVTERVVRLSPVPVLTVRAPAESE